MFGFLWMGVDIILPLVIIIMHLPGKMCTHGIYCVFLGLLGINTHYIGFL